MSRLVESYVGDELPPLDFGIPTHIPIKNKSEYKNDSEKLFNKWVQETGQCTKSEKSLIISFIKWLKDN